MHMLQSTRWDAARIPPPCYTLTHQPANAFPFPINTCVRVALAAFI